MLEQSLQIALRLAREAAIEVKRIYETPFEVQYKKEDQSPITEADRVANDIILRGLKRHFPDDPVLSEETPFDATAPRGRRLWMVDPLDGTADFAARTGDFAVMIGLCVAGQPVLGVVAAPVLGRLWAGARGLGAFEEVEGKRRPLTLRDPDPAAAVRVVVSRKHRPPAVEALLAALPGAAVLPRGSVGVKIGLIAAGEADVYLHPSAGTSLWDCAAPQAVLQAAGGLFTDAAGAPLSYDPTQTANPHGILAASSAIHQRVLTWMSDAARTRQG